MAGSKVIDFLERRGTGLNGDGGPPHNDEMEARIKALEEAVKNLPTKADMGDLRKEMKTDWSEFTNASKADFAALRADIAKGQADMAKGQADMHKAIADNHRWTHVALMGLAAFSVAGIVGVMGTIWSIGKPAAPQASAPQASQPIIINVPQAAPAPTPPPAAAAASPSAN